MKGVTERFTVSNDRLTRALRLAGLLSENERVGGCGLDEVSQLVVVIDREKSEKPENK